MYKVNEESELLNFLYSNIKQSKNTIKNLLTNKNICVNDKIVTKYNYMLKKGDIVSIKSKADDIDIIYEDKDMIVVNKPTNLLTISNAKEKEKTLFHIISTYVKRSNKNNKIFVVHRLDKDTSGIVVFSKNERFKNILQDNWNDIVKLRNYVAIVEGSTKESGQIKTYLDEKNTFIYVSKTGKLAITNYKKIKGNDKYSLLDINIETGRKNQIRVHMKHINHTVVGDKKYGSNDNSLKRLALHSNKLEFINPLNKKLMKFEVDIPNSFKKLIK